MARVFAALAIAGCIIVAACVTPRSYTICNDMAANTVCPNNTANVIVK